MIVIPQKKATSLKNEGADFLWPEGGYKGTFESFEVRPLPATSTGQPFAGYATTDGERLSIQIGNIVGLEGQEGIGQRKFFLDLALSDGDYDLSNYDKAPPEAWQLERSARYIANMAAALGQVTEVDGNLVVNDEFLDALREGRYEGAEIGFVIYHRVGGKDRKKYAEVETFIVAG